MTDWTPWHGGECPIKSPLTKFQYKTRGGWVNENPAYSADAYRWKHKGMTSDITDYRITEDHEPAPETLTEQRDRLARELAEVEARIEAEKVQEPQTVRLWGRPDHTLVFIAGAHRVPEDTHYRDFPLVGGVPEGFVPVEGE